MQTSELTRKFLRESSLISSAILHLFTPSYCVLHITVEKRNADQSCVHSVLPTTKLARWTEQMPRAITNLPKKKKGIHEGLLLIQLSSTMKKALRI